MALSRLDLHEILCEILGSCYVYFQPPESIKLNYPCIVYSKEQKNASHADDRKYITKNRYTVTIIDRNPDSDLPDKLEELPYCSSDRNFVADNLNHFVYSLYY